MENFNVFWEEEGKKTQRETEKNQEKKKKGNTKAKLFCHTEVFSNLVFSNTLMEYYLCNFANFPAKIVAMKVQ